LKYTAVVADAIGGVCRLVDEAAVHKRKRGLETTEKILEAAAELFAGSGYDVVSTRQIAERVGIKDSSLYNHFAGKHLILEALLHRFAGNIPRTRPPVSDLAQLLDVMSPAEALKALIVSFGRSIDAVINNTGRIIYAEMYRNAEAADLYRRAIVSEPTAFYAAVFQQMMDRGKLRQADAAMVAATYNGAIVALTTEHALANGEPVAATAVVRKMMATVDFFCEMLAPEPVHLEGLV
jgi:AcrR family transcriptional regulator